MADLASGSIDLTLQEAVTIPVTIYSADETQSVACEWRVDPTAHQAGLYRVSDGMLLWGGIVLSSGDSIGVSGALMAPGATGAVRLGIVNEEFTADDHSTIGTELDFVCPSYDGAQTDDPDKSHFDIPTPTGETISLWIGAGRKIEKEGTSAPYTFRDVFAGFVGAVDQLRLFGSHFESPVIYDCELDMRAGHTDKNPLDYPAAKLTGALIVSRPTETIGDLMPWALLDAPVSESLVYNATSRAWMFGWNNLASAKYLAGSSTLAELDAYSAVTGRTDEKTVALTIPATGMYEFTFNLRLSGGSSSNVWMYVYRMGSEWEPPTAQNYINETTLNADANYLAKLATAFAAMNSTYTFGSFNGVMAFDGGDIVFPTAVCTQASKTISTDDTQFCIRRIG